MLNIEILTTIPQLAAVLPEWDTLAALDPRDGYCRTGAWYLCWLQYIQRNAQPLIMVARDFGRIVGIAPFCLMQHNSYLKALTLGGSQIVCGDYLGLPCLPEYKQKVLHSVLEKVTELGSMWDLFMLPDIKKDGDLFKQVEHWAAAQGIKSRASDRQVCPYIELPASYEQYLQTVTKKKRKDLRRNREILQEHGATFEVYSHGAELEGAIDILIELHLARWRAVGNPGSLGKPGFREWLKALAKSGICAGSFRLFLLRHHGQPLAAMLNFHHGQSAFQFQNGWNPNFPLVNYSPGTVLIGYALQTAIEEGRRFYDFMRGDEEYKFRLTRCFRENVTLMLARNLSARTYLSALNMKDLAKHSVEALLEPAAA